MCPTANDSGLEREKFPDAPPLIAITAPEDVPDAGLRSLDHCKYPSWTQSLPADILVTEISFKALFYRQDKCDQSFRECQCIHTDTPWNSRFLPLIPIIFPESCNYTVLILNIYHRQAQTSTMAIQSATEAFTPDTMGDTVSCLDAG